MAGNRSPNYPSIGLGEALDIARKLYKAEKRSSMSPDVAARAMGYNALHGPARSRIGALRKYGLLDNTREGVRLSELAITILYPPTDADATAAIREAALRPGLFRELAELGGASDTNLVGRLVHQGFTEAGAKAAVASYRATISLAPTPQDDYDTSDDEEEDVIEHTPQRHPEKRFQSEQSFSFPLGMGVTAQLSVSGGALTKSLMATLQRYLDVVKDAVPPDEAPREPSPLPSTSGQPPLSEQSPGGAQD
jgi:hypothetical protein